MSKIKVKVIICSHDCIHTHAGLRAGQGVPSLPTYLSELNGVGTFLTLALEGAHFSLACRAASLRASCRHWHSQSFLCRKKKQLAVKIPAVDQRRLETVKGAQ